MKRKELEKYLNKRCWITISSGEVIEGKLIDSGMTPAGFDLTEYNQTHKYKYYFCGRWRLRARYVVKVECYEIY